MLNSQYKNRYIFVLLVTECYVYSTVIPSSLQSHSESVYPQTRLKWSQLLVSLKLRFWWISDVQDYCSQWRLAIRHLGTNDSSYSPSGQLMTRMLVPEPRLFPGLPEYSFLKPVLIPVTIQQRGFIYFL